MKRFPTMTGPGGRRGSAPSFGPGSWLVALPAWGARCARVCSEETLPALREALVELGRPAKVLLYTDSDTLAAVAASQLERAEVERRPVPPGDRSFGSLSACHRDAMARASANQRVLLLTSDMVLSREVLATCEAHCARGIRAVAVVAPRALEASGAPPGVAGRALLEWAWENRHPMTRECTWPAGRSYDVWRMYFERDGEVAARVFLPHPLVVVPAGVRVNFHPTIDVNLLGCFSPSVTYMLTRPEEGAVVELSPPDKEFLLTTPMRDRLDSGGPSCPPFVRATNARHRMFFGRRVVLRGAGDDCGDGDVVSRIMGG